MKTLIRALIILTVATLIGSAMYFAVNAMGTNLTPRFRPENERFRPSEGLQPGSRPDFERFRPEREGERSDEWGAFGLAAGMMKNLLVIGILVILFLIPGKLKKKSLPPDFSSQVSG